MVIRVCWKTVKTPSLEGSPHSSATYYEVDSLPSTEKVVRHLKGMGMRFFDPGTVVVEETDLNADELRKNEEQVYRIDFC